VKKFKSHKIEIMGKEVLVNFIPHVIHSGQYWSGMFYPDKWLIEIATEGNTEDFIKHTFLHELGHAITYRIGAIQADFSNDLQEMIVENYATVLTELWDFEL
jgi:hypothetical protein